jgi:hypothetical protein
LISFFIDICPLPGRNCGGRAFASRIGGDRLGRSLA